MSAGGATKFQGRLARAPLAGALLSVLPLSVLIGGCGGSGADRDQARDGVTPGASELVISLDPDGPGGAGAERARLSCPSSAAACGAVADLAPGAADPVPPETACTEIYGGPDQVTIRGTLRGERVEATLTRANGCEIERFERFVALLEELFPGYAPGAALGA